MRLTRLRTRPRAVRLVSSPSTTLWRYATLLLGLSALFLLDRSTEAAPIQHLYYLPIVLAAIWFGGRGSLLVSSAAVLLYHAANPALVRGPYKDTDLVQIALFFAVGLGAARVAHDRRRLQRLASTDDLTGLHNLRSFETRLTACILAARRTGHPLSLLVLDLDRLKAINDVHGHLAGGEAVRAVGHVLDERLPATACACRYGGDEFVVALPGLTVFDAAIVADDLRRAVNALAPVLANTVFPVGTLSISIGVAGMPSGQGAGAPVDPAGAGEALFRAADAALYDAKRTGRNRVASGTAFTAA
jgi:diguanylate cyclase (GGDEF)-like protein